MFQTEQQTRKESESVGHGKVEIQDQDSHFPTAPTACGNKEGNHFVEKPSGPSSVAKAGDISKEVWRLRCAPPAAQGVIVVDREK